MKLPEGFIKGIDAHTHLLLNILDYPKGFAGKASYWILNNTKKTRKRSKFLSKVLDGAIFWTDNDKLSRISNLIDKSLLTPEERIREGLLYSDKLVVLTVDLEQMSAGETGRSYETQLIEALEMKEKFPGRLLVYMMLDVRRKNLMQLVSKYHSQIDGWKYYAPVSGSINNYIVYNVLKNYPKTVIMHTTDTSPVYFRGVSKDEAVRWAEPQLAIPLIKSFPNVTFIFAHFGGKNYHHKVRAVMKRYRNAHADWSYFGDDNAELIVETNILFPKQCHWGTDMDMIPQDLFFNLPCYDNMQRNNKRVFG